MKEQSKDGLSLKKNMIYNTVGSGIYLGLQWIITILVVRISGYEDAGILSLAMSIANVIYAVASFGMRGYQSSDIENKFDNYTYIISRFLTCSVGVIAGGVFLLFTDHNIITKGAIFAYIIFKMSEAFVDVLHGLEQKKWRMDIIGISFTLRGILTFISFVIVLAITKNILVAIIAMAISAYVVIILFDIPKFKKIIEVKKNFDYKKLFKLLYICLPLTIYGFLSNGIQSYPRYLLESVTSKETLGIYSSVATPVLIIQVASGFIFNPLITLFGELYTNKKKKEFYKLVMKVMIAIVMLGILAIIAGALFGDFALSLIYEDTIKDYTYLLNFVIVATTLTTIAAFLNLLLTVVRDFKTLIIGNLVGLILSIVFSNIFIRQYLIDGINTTLIFALIIQIIYMFLIGYFKLNKYFKNTKEEIK